MVSRLGTFAVMWVQFQFTTFSDNFFPASFIALYKPFFFKKSQKRATFIILGDKNKYIDTYIICFVLFLLLMCQSLFSMKL